MKQTPYFFILPSILILAFTSLYPICYSIYYSFFNWRWGNEKDFIGLSNYIILLTDKKFWIIIKNTFPEFRIFSFSTKFNKVLKKIIVSNIDFFIRTILILTSIMMFTAIGARLGNLILAANSILILLQMFLSYGLDGFAQAAEVLVGNAYGAKKKILLKKIFKVIES